MNRDVSPAGARRRRPVGIGSRRILFVLVLFLVTIGAAVVLGACGASIGEVQEFSIDEPLGGAAVTDVEVVMGAGTLSVSPGAAGLASGTVRYNVEPWKPKLSRDDDSLTIKQGEQKGLSGLGSGILNEWSVVLGAAPIRLKVTAGAYKGTYDLGGLTLLGLAVKDGASDAEVRFDSPNLGQIDLFKYETGASKVSMTGLADAHFEKMEFTGGAGSYSLDFSGRLRTDADVRIKAGVGNLEIRVPAATAARVTVEGALNDISLQGTWTSAERVYTNPAMDARAAGPALSIRVDMSVGTLKLVTE